MESLSLFLQDYKDLVASVAGIVTIGQFLAGAFICKDIYQQGNTKGIAATPFVGGIVIGVLMYKYSLMLDDTAMLVVNIAGTLLNVVYLLFYFVYSQTKNEVFKSIGVGMIITLVLLAYSVIENPDLVEYRYGLILTVMMLVLIGSPLLELREVIGKKDASSIPFPLVFCGSIVSFLWLIYGIILLNDFMIFQNLIGLVLCFVQLLLCMMYPKKQIAKKEKAKKID